MIFTDPIIRFTSDPSEVTAGAHRGECGELVAGGQDYVQETTGAVSVSPRHAADDTGGKLPTMLELWSNGRAGEILNRPPINLTGWTQDEQREPWSFVGAHSDV